jgi:hypothetical protein
MWRLHMALLLLCGASALPAPQEASNLMAPPQFQPPLKTLQEGLEEPAVVREALEPRTGELPTGQPLTGEPAEPPKEKSPKEIIHQIDGSTFCFMVYKVGVEDDVVRYMFKNHIGVFACDDHAVFSLFDASDPEQPGCKYGGSMEDGCLIDGGAGVTSKPLVFNMSLLPPLDESKAIGSWVAQKETTQVRQSTLVRQSGLVPQSMKLDWGTKLDWGNDGRWQDPQAENDWGAPEKERKNDKRTPAEKQADAERKIKKAEEEIKQAEEDAKKQTEKDLDTVKKAQEENQKAADEAAAESAKAVADAQKDIDKAAKANEDAADSARAAAAKDVDDIEKAQKAAGAAAGAATQSAEHSLDDAEKAAGVASDAESSAATASAASDMDAAKAEEKIASAAASAQATESARVPADGEAATADGVAAPAMDCVSLDPTSVTDDWCSNTCGSAPALAAAAAGASVCPEDLCVCGEDAEAARATAASESGSTFEDETAAESDAAEAAAAEKAAAEATAAEANVRIALFSNTPIFLAAWRSLFEKGTLFNHEWIVKVDADTMFLPDRLKDWLPVATPDPMKVANCMVPIAANTPDASLTFGALEVINVAAARAYQLAMDGCEATVPLDHGEDHFMHECASDDWQVSSDAAVSKGMVMDPACTSSFKAGCEFDSVSFHPYQDLKEFELCHNESKKVTRQQNKDAAESWTAAGEGDGVQTGAHHGAYEKNGLKTIKEPSRAV